MREIEIKFSSNRFSDFVFILKYYKKKNRQFKFEFARGTLISGFLQCYIILYSTRKKKNTDDYKIASERILHIFLRHEFFSV